MRIKQLHIQSVRIFEDITIKPGPGLNLITGLNGAGKTSVLEAIYLLGRGKSFRHKEAGPLVRKGQQRCQLLANLQREDNDKVQVLGMYREASSAKVKFSGQEIKRRSELLKILPLQLVTPASHALIEDTPDIRRRFLDHGLFHVKHQYHNELTSYHRVLKQRNAALRQRNDRIVRSFDQQLIEFAEVLDVDRSTYVVKLATELSMILTELDMPFSIALQYYHGWDITDSLSSVLSGKLSQDMERGFTSVGPQRANLKILCDGVIAAKHLSRGQQKILIYSLKLAECRILAREKGIKPIFLIDDVSAELDRSNLEKILRQVAALGLQTFITAVDRIVMPADIPVSLFHVEHGGIIAVE